MRHSGLLAVFAVITVLLATGCGGGNSTTSVNSVWTGAFVEAGSVGNTGTLQAAFVQNGTNLSGSLVTTTIGSSAINAINGTINGNQLTATLTLNIPQSTPISNPTALRTDRIQGFGAPNWYSTSAPIDLSKPLTVSIAGTVLSASQYTVDRTNAYANRIYLPVLVPPTSIVEIQYYPYNPTAISPVAANKTIYTGTVTGNTIMGTYTLSNSSGAPEGTFTLTKAVGMTTADLVGHSANWTGTYTIGAVTHTLSLRFVQNKASLTFSGTVGTNGSSATTAITGTGAVIGTNVTLIFVDGSETVYLTGVFATNTASADAISGTTLDSSESTGAFTITPTVSDPDIPLP